MNYMLGLSSNGMSISLSAADIRLPKQRHAVIPNNDSTNALSYMWHSNFQFIFLPVLRLISLFETASVHAVVSMGFSPLDLPLYVSVLAYFCAIAAIINP